MLKGTGVSAGWAWERRAGAEGTGIGLVRREVCRRNGGKSSLAAAAAAVSAKLEAMAAAMAEQVGAHVRDTGGQSMMLADRPLCGPDGGKHRQGAPPRRRWTRSCQSFMQMFGAMEDELMRQRATDIGDLARGCSRPCWALRRRTWQTPPAGSVLVARDFTPA